MSRVRKIFKFFFLFKNINGIGKDRGAGIEYLYDPHIQCPRSLSGHGFSHSFLLHPFFHLVSSSTLTVHVRIHSQLLKCPRKAAYKDTQGV